MYYVDIDESAEVDDDDDDDDEEIKASKCVSALTLNRIRDIVYKCHVSVFQFITVAINYKRNEKPYIMDGIFSKDDCDAGGVFLTQ